MRAAIIGAGGVGARHARVLDAMAEVEVVAVCDVDEARATALASEVGAAALTRPADVVAERPDAVWVCVPPFAHGEPEDAVLGAGLPMFVEKPVAADLPHAVALAERVRAAGVPTAVGYHWRHLDTVARMAEAARAQPPVAASAWWVGSLPPPAWWRRVEGSGGQVVEQATHVLDLLRVLVGEVDEVSAVSARTGLTGPADEPDWVDDATAAWLRFEGGQVASVQVTCAADRTVRAGLELVLPGTTLLLRETDLTTWSGKVDPVTTEPGADARDLVDAAFVEVVRRGTAEPTRPGALGLVDYAEAVRTHALGIAITTSARDRSPVRVPDLLGGA